MNRVPRQEQLDRWLAVALTAAGELALWVGNAMPGVPRGLGSAIVVLICAAVAVRRRSPFAAAMAAFGGTTLIFVVGGNNYSPPLMIAWLCSLYGLAVWTGTREFVAGLVVFAATNSLASLGSGIQFQDSMFFTAVPGVAMVIARRVVRERQLLADAMKARAELLERESEARAGAAIAEERARIARELHDLVAHNVSVMVVQAGAERHALADDQGATREVLSSIEDSGRQALAEARRLLGMLRRGAEAQGLEPQPGLSQLEALVEQVRRAGLSVTTRVEGERVELPAGLDLCAYRVVQESLTNALKHAGPAEVEVTLRYAPRALSILVTDDGRGAASPNGAGGGHGLVGMRERVALYGGRFDAGPREGQGFQVAVELPLA